MSDSTYDAYTVVVHLSESSMEISKFSLARHRILDNPF